MGGAAGSDGRDRSASRGLAASTWYGLAVVGAILFGLGIWTPAWRGIDGASVLQIVVAAAGGAVFVVGAIFGSRASRPARRASIEAFPGVEVYRPTTGGPVAPPPGRADGSVTEERPR